MGCHAPALEGLKPSSPEAHAQSLQGSATTVVGQGQGQVQGQGGAETGDNLGTWPMEVLSQRAIAARAWPMPRGRA